MYPSWVLFYTRSVLNVGISRQWNHPSCVCHLGVWLQVSPSAWYPRYRSCFLSKSWEGVFIEFLFQGFSYIQGCFVRLSSPLHGFPLLALNNYVYSDVWCRFNGWVGMRSSNQSYNHTVHTPIDYTTVGISKYSSGTYTVSTYTLCPAKNNYTAAWLHPD